MTDCPLWRGVLRDMKTKVVFRCGYFLGSIYRQYREFSLLRYLMADVYLLFFIG